MEICAKTELEFLPDNCRACPLNEQFSPNVDAKCRLLRTYMHDGSNERPTKCPLKAKAEGVFIDCTAMDKLPGGCEECEMGDRYGCVGDVYCRILNDYFTGNVTPPCKERPDKCPLMEVPHKSSSLPTYADFLEMDGDPVFITLHQNTDGTHGGRERKDGAARSLQLYGEMRSGRGQHPMPGMQHQHDRLRRQGSGAGTRRAGGTKGEENRHGRAAALSDRRHCRGRGRVLLL